MNPEALFLISRISYILAAISLLLGIILWYKAGIPRLIRDLKSDRPFREREGPAADNEAKDLKTEELTPLPEIIMLEDIVITHCVSTLVD